MGFENPLSPPPRAYTPEVQAGGMPCKWGDSPFTPVKQSGEGLAEGYMVSLLGGGIGDSRDVVTCGGLGLTAVVCVHRSSRFGMVPLRRDGHWPGAWLCHRLPGGPGHVTYSL